MIWPKVSFGFCAAVCLLAWLDWRACLFFLGCSACHELGHLIMMKLLGVKMLAVRLGAAKAVIIPAEQVVLSAEFTKICESNSCGRYGRCWMCPPEIGDIEPLMEKVRGYRYGLLYQTISELEDSFDIEGMFEAGAAHAQLSQRLDAALKRRNLTGFLHLSCGGCHLCERCSKLDNLPCRHPDKALSSLEGYGIDVYSTTKDTPLSYINGENTVTYFGAVFFSEE